MPYLASPSALALSVAADDAGLIDVAHGAAVGVSSTALVGYLVVRCVVPIVLIVHAGRGATPTQRVELARAYLLAALRRSPRRRVRARSQRIGSPETDDAVPPPAGDDPAEG